MGDRDGVVVTAMDEGDGHVDSRQVLDQEMIEDHSPQRPAVGRPGVAGTIGGNLTREIPHHERGQRDGNGA